MARRTSKKEKKRLFIISVAIISLLTLLVGSVYNTWNQILDKNDLKVVLEGEYNELLDEEVRLSAEITKLQDDEYLARYAKEKFMLSKEGDIIIKTD